MSRPHQLWMYVGKDDKSRVSSADLSDDELRDEVRRLTRFSQKDNIVLTSARPPYEFNSNDDDEIPLAKRAKLLSGKAESAKESNPSPADPTPPSRTTVVKIQVSKVIPPTSTPVPPAARDHPIYATVDAVADFADQFTRPESENVQLRKTIKISTDQVLEANKLIADAKNENILLKEELKKLKKKMKDEHDARREAVVAAGAADVPMNRAHKLREDSMSDALSLAVDANIRILGLLQKTKGALSRLFSMIFPKLKQDKTLGEMADAFFIDPSEPIEKSNFQENPGIYVEGLIFPRITEKGKPVEAQGPHTLGRRAQRAPPPRWLLGLSDSSGLFKVSI
ncbi:hypothetical protein QYE76_034753 [Lolium multiflorum]|uniref:Uncharacterized protein n=1 Tax=Lolium multiflorum TaxID=4521 RepID=A0AAD8QZ79_LOLMU|nr:hypothetical protein QYE76_034753 [Lolium multiflorum]